jgi:serine/threonine protein kinase
LQGVVHRDLKLENVLFDSEAKNRIKVVDFGIAGIVTDLHSDKNTAATLKYMTPEMVTQVNSVASPPMDVWAIGIMTYCILFNRLPFTGSTREIIKNLISTSELVTPKEITVTPQCQQFLNGCLNKNPSDRLTIKAMLDSPWFRLTEE